MEAYVLGVAAMEKYVDGLDISYWHSLYSPDLMKPGVWHHVVASHGGDGETKIFVDGQELP